MGKTSAFNEVKKKVRNTIKERDEKHKKTETQKWREIYSKMEQATQSQYFLALALIEVWVSKVEITTGKLEQNLWIVEP